MLLSALLIIAEKKVWRRNFDNCCEHSCDQVTIGMALSKKLP